MRIALEEAKNSAQRGEVPVGAVLVDKKGKVLSQSGNRMLELADPTAHAEILVIKQACKKLGSDRLPETDLYVTLEPCTMCTAAISFARVKRLYFGAYDVKGGAVESGVCFYNQKTCHHKPEVYGGFLETESSDLLKKFFADKR